MSQGVKMILSDMNSTMQRRWLNLLDSFMLCLPHTRHWLQPTLHGLHIRIHTDVGYVTFSVTAEHSGYTWKDYVTMLMHQNLKKVETEVLI